MEKEATIPIHTGKNILSASLSGVEGADSWDVPSIRALMENVAHLCITISSFRHTHLHNIETPT